MKKNKDASKGDVGLILARRAGYVSMVSVVPGGSASKNNLSTGDVIEAINGVATRDMPLAYAEMLLRGEPGSSIEITVLRLRNPEPSKITLTRNVAKYPDVIAKTVENGIGMRAQSTYHVRSKRNVRHEMSVHDVEMDPVSPRLDDISHLFPKPRVVSGED